MVHPYRQLFETGSIRSAYLAVLLSAVPLGTISLALVLSVQSWSGSLALAGGITALFTIGNAIGLSSQGWLLDRFGNRPVLIPSGAVCALCLGSIAVLGHEKSAAWLAIVVTVAGISVPAITASVRKYLPLVMEDSGLRSAGYAALSVVFQVALAMGPVLVTIAVVAFGKASYSLLVAAGMIAIATILFCFAVPSKRPPREQERIVPTSGPVTRLLALYAVAALTGIAAGFSTIAVPGVTAAAGAAALAGIAFAATAIGDMAGALVFGSRSWPLAPPSQLRFALAAACALAFAVYLSSASVWLLVVAMGLAGALNAPVTIRLSSLLDDFVRPAALGRAYATLVGVGLLAVSAGAALAGQLSVWLEPRQLLLGPPMVFLLAACVSTYVRGRPSAPSNAV